MALKMPKRIVKTATNAIGAPTQSNNPYATDIPVEADSPADSPPVNTDLISSRPVTLHE